MKYTYKIIIAALLFANAAVAAPAIDSVSIDLKAQQAADEWSPTCVISQIADGNVQPLLHMQLTRFRETSDSKMRVAMGPVETVEQISLDTGDKIVVKIRAFAEKHTNSVTPSAIEFYEMVYLFQGDRLKFLGSGNSKVGLGQASGATMALSEHVLVSINCLYSSK